MSSKLEAIVQAQQRRLSELRGVVDTTPEHPITQCLSRMPEPERARSFKAALDQPGLSIVAEIKRRSPSVGALSAIEQPVDLARQYERAGACAVSVLTETNFFNGSLDDLLQVVERLLDHLENDPAMPVRCSELFQREFSVEGKVKQIVDGLLDRAD